MKIFNVRTMRDFDVYSDEVNKKGVYTICGRSKTLEVGDVIESGKVGFQVKSIERRDHKGVFRKAKDKKNSFFTATCEQVEMYDIREQLKQEEDAKSIAVEN